MLKTRVITASVLLAVLLAILSAGSFFLFVVAALVFMAGASWENFRLMGMERPWPWAVVWASLFGVLAFGGKLDELQWLFGLCVLIWILRLAPTLAVGLPPRARSGVQLLTVSYSIAILGCFLAMLVLFDQSPLYLISVLAIVWVADIGAYFSGKAYGRRKLAPSISPGKSWEGAIGGWLAVLVLSIVAVNAAPEADLFPVALQASWGWPGFLLVITALVALSVVGDLFESLLKRRADMKDSSALLPGHGGVLDRIDALIPVLPLVVLVHSWL